MDYLKSGVKWGEANGVVFEVKSGRPRLYIVASIGFRDELVYRFEIVEYLFIFLVGSKERDIDLSFEEIRLLIERKNVPVGLFMTYLGEPSNLKPVFNWLLKTVKNKQFKEFLIIAENLPRLSNDAPPPIPRIISRRTVTPPEEYIRYYQSLLQHLRSKYVWLESFTEMDHSRILLDRLGPTYSLTEAEWMRAYGEYPFK